MKLVIGNKAYSSWSLRPWILMAALDIPFEEDLVPLDTPEFRPRVSAYKAGSTVPILVDGDVTVWESLSIMEYLADRFPDRGIWPADIKARAMARTLASEMHAGFRALRAACPMNLRKRYAHKDRGELVVRDVARAEDLFRRARAAFGEASGQPFLFGSFGAVDAMYTPLLTRLHTYSWPVSPVTRAYIDAVQALPAFRSWQAAGMAEPWIVAHDEVDEPSVGAYFP